MKRIFFPAAAAMLFFAVGCRSVNEATIRDREVFEQVSGQLDADGSYYRIQNPVYLFESLGRMDGRLDDALAHSKLPDSLRGEIIRYKALLNLMIRLSGVSELQGCGASSVLLEPGKDGHGNLFRNRMFLALPENPRGFLWHLTGAENRPLARDLAALPANTILAADFVFRPVEVFREIQQSEVLKSELENVALNLGMEPGELLDEISGEWAILLTAQKNATLDDFSHMNFTLLMPDKKKRIFDLLKNLVQLMPDAKVENDLIIFGPNETLRMSGMEPRVTWADGQLAVYSSNAAIEELAANGPRLAATPEFRRLMRDLPATGAGFWYTGSGYWKLLERVVETAATSGTFTMEIESELPSHLTILRHEPDGILAVGNSNWDYNQMEFAGQVFLPLLLLTQAGLPQMEESEEDSAEVAARQAACNVQCTKNLQTLKEALAAYAGQHEGKFPAGEDIGGLKELLTAGLATPEEMICPGADGDEAAENAEAFSFANASYIYFGGRSRSDNGKLPLLADWPFNHPERVNILLLDGTVESLEADDVTTCKRIVGFLQARYKYDEADFRELIRQADKLDKLFELD